MPKGSLLSAACVLLLLLNSVAPKCQEFAEDVCQEHKDFVPGHSLAGKGFDVTTLQRKGANLFDMHQWENPDGSCTLCQNPLLEGKPLQRLPLVVADWEVDISSHRKLRSSLKESGLSVVEGAGADVKNDWRMGLDVEMKPEARAQVTLAGSHSKMADFSIEKSGKDKYSFASHEVSSIFEIVGGNSHADLLFSDELSKEAFQEWLESLKTMPGLVSYSLAPIHTLVAKEDPRRESQWVLTMLHKEGDGTRPEPI